MVSCLDLVIEDMGLSLMTMVIVLPFAASQLFRLGVR
jgi:hypothetical protein